MNADGSGLVTLPKLREASSRSTRRSRPTAGASSSTHSMANSRPSGACRLDGTQRRLIKTGPTADPNASPDGRRLGFMGFNGNPGARRCSPVVDGSNPLPLTPFSFNVGIKQDWSPDGQRLAFTHNADFAHPDDSANIATIRRDGAGLRFVTTYRGGRATPSSAPTRPTAAGSCSGSRTTGATACTRCAPTARTSGRSSGCRRSRRASSTGALRPGTAARRSPSPAPRRGPSRRGPRRDGPRARRRGAGGRARPAATTPGRRAASRPRAR